MTDTQQLSNEQLSIKVARLKGWRGVVRNPHGQGEHDATEADYAEARPFNIRWWPPAECPNQRTTQSLPAYAVSIEAAWELMHDMLNAEPGTSMVDMRAVYPGSGDAPDWYVNIDGNEGQDYTLERAICAAFIAWKESQ